MLSLKQLLHREAPGDHALPVHAVDGHLEVAPVLLDAEGIHLGIAGCFAALEKQAVDLVGILPVPFTATMWLIWIAPCFLRQALAAASGSAITGLNPASSGIAPTI